MSAGSFITPRHYKVLTAVVLKPGSVQIGGRSNWVLHRYQSEQNNKNTVFLIERLGTAIWRGPKIHMFSVDGANAIRKVSQVLKVI
jgi:hypothetical protein